MHSHIGKENSVFRDITIRILLKHYKGFVESCVPTIIILSHIKMHIV